MYAIGAPEDQSSVAINLSSDWIVRNVYSSSDVHYSDTLIKDTNFDMRTMPQLLLENSLRRGFK